MNLLQLLAGVFDRLRRRLHVIKVGAPGCLLNQLFRDVPPPELLRLPGVDAAREDLVKGLLRLLRLLLRDLQVVISNVLMVEDVVFKLPSVTRAVELLTFRKVLRDLELVHRAQPLLERGLEEFFALILLGDSGMLRFVHGLIFLQALLDVLLVGDEAGTDLDLSAGGSELDCVANEVHEDLCEAGLVDLQRVRHVLADH